MTKAYDFLFEGKNNEYDNEYKDYIEGGNMMKAKANKDFTVHFVGGSSFDIKKGDGFYLVATYIDLSNQEPMAVIHRGYFAPFAVHLENVDIVQEEK